MLHRKPLVDQLFEWLAQSTVLVAIYRLPHCLANADPAFALDSGLLNLIQGVEKCPMS